MAERLVGNATDWYFKLKTIEKAAFKLYSQRPVSDMLQLVVTLTAPNHQTIGIQSHDKLKHIGQ
jgi:hypothetical protein